MKIKQLLTLLIVFFVCSCATVNLKHPSELKQDEGVVLFRVVYNEAYVSNFYKKYVHIYIHNNETKRQSAKLESTQSGSTHIFSFEKGRHFFKLATWPTLTMDQMLLNITNLPHFKAIPGKITYGGDIVLHMSLPKRGLLFNTHSADYEIMYKEQEAITEFKMQYPEFFKELEYIPVEQWQAQLSSERKSTKAKLQK